MKDLSLLLMRLAFGGLMFFNHGLSKFDKLNGQPIKFPDPLGVGAELSLYLTLFAEGVSSVLIVLGLFTRFASVPLVITMAVAAFVIHGSDPITNKESSLLYLAAYILILTYGAGKFSLDKVLRPNAKF